MMLTNLADIARSAGLTVVELPGWKTNTRPGPFAPKGVACHHTGGAADSRKYAEWMAFEGRDDLPAPLCQLALSREGIVYVSAAGRSNHAGKNRAVGDWLPAGDGNAQLIGIEAMNTGSEGWTAVQLGAYVALCAALCKAFKWPASHVVAHKEISLTGKWDPGLIDMGDFRSSVAKALTNTSVQQGNLTMNQYAELDQRLRLVEGRVGPTTEARAQYAYKEVTAGGNLHDKVVQLDGQVSGNTDARAQWAYERAQQLTDTAALQASELASLKQVTAAQADRIAAQEREIAALKATQTGA